MDSTIEIIMNYTTKYPTLVEIVLKQYGQERRDECCKRYEIINHIVVNAVVAE